MTGIDYVSNEAQWNTAMDRSWVNVLSEYYEDPAIRFCVAANRARNGNQADPKRGWASMNVGTSGEDILEGSYGINWWVNNPKQTQWDAGAFPPENKWRKTSVGNANMIPVLGDSTYILARPQHDDQPPQVDGTPYFSNYGLDRYCVTRHNRTINLLFMDFSVRPVNIKGELWSLKWHRNFDNTNNTGQNLFLDPDANAWNVPEYSWVP